MPANSEDGDDARLERRAFLTRGGLVAGGAALGAALTMSPAGAQEATVVDYTYQGVKYNVDYASRQEGSSTAAATMYAAAIRRNAGPIVPDGSTRPSPARDGTPTISSRAPARCAATPAGTSACRRGGNWWNPCRRTTN